MFPLLLSSTCHIRMELESSQDCTEHPRRLTAHLKDLWQWTGAIPGRVLQAQPPEALAVNCRGCRCHWQCV